MRRWALIGVVVALLVVGSMPVFQFCDGPAPGWARSEGGCARWSLLEYALPWHWGVPDQCLGMCPDSLGS